MRPATTVWFGRRPLHKIEVVPCGPLAKRFKPVTICASSAAEAIEGWSYQSGMSDVPMYLRPLIQAEGFPTETELRADTDVTRIELYPAMIGGSAIGKIILGAVLIAAAIFIPGLGQALAIGLLSAGASMMLGGIMQLFMKAPSVSKSEDPEASKYINGAGNTVKIGTLIGIGGGRMMVGGQILSVQVNSNELVYGKFPATP